MDLFPSDPTTIPLKMAKDLVNGKTTRGPIPQAHHRGKEI